MMVQACKPGTWDAGAGGYFKFKASPSSLRPYLKKSKRTVEKREGLLFVSILIATGEMFSVPHGKLVRSSKPTHLMQCLC